jgi:hypothetical protein
VFIERSTKTKACRKEREYDLLVVSFDCISVMPSLRYLVKLALAMTLFAFSLKEIDELQSLSNSDESVHSLMVQRG